MFKWVKQGHIFNPCRVNGTPWVQEFAQTPNTLIFKDRVRVYFTTRTPKDNDGRLKSLLAYVDLDKNNLFNILKISEQPILKLGQRGHFDEFGTYLLAPIRISETLVRGYYVGLTCTKSVPLHAAIGLAESNDNGENFKKIGVGPVFGQTLHDPFVVSSHKIRQFHNKFFLFYTSGTKWLMKDNRPEPIYKLKMACSDDGLNWERFNQLIMEDKLGPNEAQACPDVIYKNNKYHMFFCYRGAFDYRKNPKNSYRIGYASSTDLYTWKRDDSKAGIDISTDENAFDHEMVAYPHVFEVNGKTYMLYVGNEVGRYGFGLAELEGKLG